MEFAGSAALGKEFHSAAIAASASSSIRRCSIGRVSFFSRRSCGIFADDGHLQYYGSTVRCGGRKEENILMKRREELVKGLTRSQISGDLDLAVMSGCEVDDGKIAVDKVADALLARLSMLRAEEKKMKKRMKMEKKAAKKASAELIEFPCDSSSSSEDEDDLKNSKTMSCKKTKCEDSSSSSSSSSESSDSDCKEKPINMKDLRSIPAEIPLLEKPQESRASPASMKDLRSAPSEIPPLENGASPAIAVSIPGKRIEVCMGGKCKKLGAMELMQEFQQRVGAEEAVVGCKCMGKCKQAPSVRVRTSTVVETGESMAPLFLGVGVQDVSAIVSNFFSENKDLGFASA